MPQISYKGPVKTNLFKTLIPKEKEFDVVFIIIYKIRSASPVKMRRER